ncbi:MULTISPECIES: hypothetical protein [Burkholderia]|uniref:Uncharacterized protein n=1 Tax=Burkholderia savannae TaxID=1637837 RepID=A0ABR5TBB3_9BURK|nr:MULTISPECIES: hypothetical protein [Burkholderia]KVK71577.1 hypothetical protein WS91_24110 [Burkholderia sp. MSMB1498]KWZ39077.1 hypothetical protein WS72_30390 [Burkholderia savannae]KWZ48917.1 hypothetical protein WS73_10835 [Burkholderia savannae]
MLEVDHVAARECHALTEQKASARPRATPAGEQTDFVATTEIGNGPIRRHRAQRVRHGVSIIEADAGRRGGR